MHGRADGAASSPTTGAPRHDLRVHLHGADFRAHHHGGTLPAAAPAARLRRVTGALRRILLRRGHDVLVRGQPGHRRPGARVVGVVAGGASRRDRGHPLLLLSGSLGELGRDGAATLSIPEIAPAVRESRHRAGAALVSGPETGCRDAEGVRGPGGLLPTLESKGGESLAEFGGDGRGDGKHMRCVRASSLSVKGPPNAVQAATAQRPSTYSRLAIRIHVPQNPEIRSFLWRNKLQQQTLKANFESFWASSTVSYSLFMLPAPTPSDPGSESIRAVRLARGLEGSKRLPMLLMLIMMTMDAENVCWSQLGWVWLAVVETRRNARRAIFGVAYAWCREVVPAKPWVLLSRLCSVRKTCVFSCIAFRMLCKRRPRDSVLSGLWVCGHCSRGEGAGTMPMRDSEDGACHLGPRQQT
nr:hypothetical protein CFP56_10462 [Quercus suber]